MVKQKEILLSTTVEILMFQCLQKKLINNNNQEKKIPHQCYKTLKKMYWICTDVGRMAYVWTAGFYYQKKKKKRGAKRKS